MQEIVVARSAEGTLPGEDYLADTPVLRPHAGTQPDLFLRWNRLPPAATAIDVVVHLHGFSQQGATMPLAEKVARCGLDLAGRTRPTLVLIPRGNWLRHTWYDFPALLSGGLDRLVKYGLARFAAAVGAGTLALDRLILTAHSGGGMPAIDAIAGARRLPDEVFIFDGLYGRDPAGGNPMQGLETFERWLGERFADEPRRRGALRIVYIERQTGVFSRQVAALIRARLMAVDPALAKDLARRYRVEPSGVPHGDIARRCHPELLCSAETEFDWTQ